MGNVDPCVPKSIAKGTTSIEYMKPCLGIPRSQGGQASMWIHSELSLEQLIASPCIWREEPSLDLLSKVCSS